MSEEFQNIDSTFLSEVKKNSGLTIAVAVIVLLMGSRCVRRGVRWLTTLGSVI